MCRSAVSSRMPKEMKLANKARPGGPQTSTKAMRETGGRLGAEVEGEYFIRTALNTK